MSLFGRYYLTLFDTLFHLEDRKLALGDTCMWFKTLGEQQSVGSEPIIFAT